MTKENQENQETQAAVEGPVYMEPTIATEPDKEKGINQPGVTQGMTYTDSNGNIRHKYETLSSLSSQTIENLLSNKKGARNEKTKETPKQKKADPADEKPKSDTDTSTEAEIEPAADASEADSVEKDQSADTKTKSTKKKK